MIEQESSSARSIFGLIVYVTYLLLIILGFTVLPRPLMKFYVVGALFALNIIGFIFFRQRKK